MVELFFYEKGTTEIVRREEVSLGGLVLFDYSARKTNKDEPILGQVEEVINSRNRVNNGLVISRGFLLRKPTFFGGAKFPVGQELSEVPKTYFTHFIGQFYTGSGPEIAQVLRDNWSAYDFYADCIGRTLF